MPRPKSPDKPAKAPKSIASTRSHTAFVKSICDIMRRSNCAGALQYVPELTWMLFLRILDQQETRAAAESAASGLTYTPALPSPYRWQDWAAPKAPKRVALEAAKVGSYFTFVNGELLPFLHNLAKLSTGAPNPAASPRQQVIALIMTAVERTRIDSEANFRDILDLVHQLNIDDVDDQHFFTLSQVFEGLLLKMGEKNSDGGQFFTPREVIRAMVRVVDPKLGETVYDPCCGTGGFLAQAFEYMQANLGDEALAEDVEALKHTTFYGREKDNAAFPIGLANLILHGIDSPNIWHGNALTGAATDADLFGAEPALFDVILTNPPFGGSEGPEAQKNFAYETSSTQALFLQKVLAELKSPLDGKPGGRCAIVLDEGLLFRTNEQAFVDTKAKLLDECDLWCIVSLPGGVFTTAGAGVKTNLLFFAKGPKTERIWYYDLTHVKMGKKSPMTLAHFGFGKAYEILADDALPASLVLDWRELDGNADKPFPTFARMLAHHGTPAGESDFSWTVDMAERRAKAQADKEPQLAAEQWHKEEVLRLKDKWGGLRRKGGDSAELEALRQQIATAEKAANGAKDKAKNIDAAVYDLKAVNPRARVDRDTRTVAEIMDNIAIQGQIIAEAMDRLRGLLSNVAVEAQ